MSAWTGDLDETVINMSLGIPTENEADKLALNTLDFLIGYADQQGAIFVAAAGNDSPGKDKDGNTVDPMPMQIPASYDKVWGVMATNPDGSRSCFSNEGEVSAPGGQGGPADQPDGTRDPCAPRTSNSNTGINPCSASNVENCEYGLISLGLTRDGPQYMFWSGSSFAAPLVSGLIALAYEEGEKPQIECLMRAGVRPVLGALPADPNMGIINIRMSLSSAALSACGVTP
jgi:subtilisin family serine protease